MKIYLAGPMRGCPWFNFPAFFEAETTLLVQGHEVFNPAKRDLQKWGAEIMLSSTGNLDDIKHLGFSLRDTLGNDLDWLCKKANAIALLPKWEISKGAIAEFYTAKALNLEVWYL